MSWTRRTLTHFGPWTAAGRAAPVLRPVNAKASRRVEPDMEAGEAASPVQRAWSCRGSRKTPHHARRGRPAEPLRRLRGCSGRATLRVGHGCARTGIRRSRVPQSRPRLGLGIPAVLRLGLAPPLLRLARRVPRRLALKSGAEGKDSPGPAGTRHMARGVFIPLSFSTALGTSPATVARPARRRAHRPVQVEGATGSVGRAACALVSGPAPPASGRAGVAAGRSFSPYTPRQNVALPICSIASA